ncbi:MAG: hypothetical protein QOG92_757, partial [Verrucomicrobiota bacterium]|nr:hypothetical protein [Verrucomicrobiota bacterium]
ISGLRQVLAGLGKEKYQEKRSIMLVGHEPDFGILAGILIGGCPESVHFRKAALMDLTVRELKPGGATIEFLVPVKCL